MSNLIFNMLIIRRYKHSDNIATYHWLLVVLFCIAESIALEVIDRNLDQPHPFELDLLARISRNNNDSRIDPKVLPSALVTADRTSRSVVFVDEYRQLEVDHKLMRSLENLLINSTEVTLLTAIKQYPDSTGTIIALDVDSVRLMEIASHGPTSEMGIFFQGGNSSYTQRFPYRFDEDPWHKLAITLEVHRVVIRINCKAFFEFPLPEHELGMLRWRNISLWIGKRNDNSIHNAEQSKGAFGEVQVKAGHDAYLSQCNYMEKSTPLQAGLLPMDLHQLQNQVDSLENALRLLTTKVAESEIRMSYLETQNGLTCHFRNGSTFHENESWEDDCRRCVCRQGMAVCEEIVCDPECMDSNMIPEGQCCPVCPKKEATCVHFGVTFPAGETVWIPTSRGCRECTCNRCDPAPREPCPKLNCPSGRVIPGDGACCPRCKIEPSCGLVGICPENSVCEKGQDGKDSCKCKGGFHFNGTHCNDIDECRMKRPGQTRPLCRDNSSCRNTLGSFSCDCHAGYEHINPRSCRDVNECQRKSDRCHANAKCLNTEGSYNCQCMDGYEGDGFKCTPICDASCEDGGHYCVAPYTCGCKPGFFGPECEVDADECTFNISSCKNNSYCINIPGSFFCKCMDGYEPVNIYAQEPICRDIDECSTGAHNCPPSTQCENLDGSWKCVCNSNQSCDLSCSDAKNIYEKSLMYDSCDNCSCQNGAWRCSILSCDCADRMMNRDKLMSCCPNCMENKSSVSYCYDDQLNATYPPGFTWFENCMSCECRFGEIDCSPITCPPVPCDNRTQIQPSGTCCPKCSTSAQNSTDLCFDKKRQSRIIPIKFGCDQEKPANSTFFQNWQLDICDLCDCQENSICCSVHNECAQNARFNSRTT